MTDSGVSIDVIENIMEVDKEIAKMRRNAVIPPIMLDPRERRPVYTDNNGLIEDMEAVYKSRQLLNVWTASEKEIFKKKYLQHPKNFFKIASYLDRKSVSDCVQYYYLSKKKENYKQLLLEKRQQARSKRNPHKVNSAVGARLTTGVTTRLQWEQQQAAAAAAAAGGDRNSTAASTSEQRYLYYTYT